MYLKCVQDVRIIPRPSILPFLCNSYAKWAVDQTRMRAPSPNYFPCDDISALARGYCDCVRSQSIAAHNRSLRPASDPHRWMEWVQLPPIPAFFHSDQSRNLLDSNRWVCCSFASSAHDTPWAANLCWPPAELPIAVEMAKTVFPFPNWFSNLWNCECRWCMAHSDEDKTSPKSKRLDSSSSKSTAMQLCSIQFARPELLCSKENQKQAMIGNLESKLERRS